MIKNIEQKINIHATALFLDGLGILLMGKSGSGKSDLALRLIKQNKGELIADDRTELRNNNGQITASAPKILQGLLEVRGIGIIKQKFLESQKIDIIIDLDTSPQRIPAEEESREISGISLPLFYLNSFEISATLKVELIIAKIKERMYTAF